MSIIKSFFIAVMAIAVSHMSNAQIVKAEIVATGLTCSMCSNAINKQLKSLAEVENVDIDLNTNRFIVHLRKGNSANPKLLKDSVEKAGFFVGSMVLTMQFDEEKISDNAKIQKNAATFVFVDTKTKTLNGATKIRVLDKGFVTQKEYKRLRKSFSKYPTYGEDNENDYHVKTI